MCRQDDCATIKWSSAKGLRIFGHCFIVCIGWCLSTLFVSCGSPSDSEFPSVKLDFATAFSNDLGEIDQMRLDDGRLLSLDKPVLASGMSAGDSVRVVSYYEVNAQNQLEIFSMRLAETVVPVLEAIDSQNVPIEFFSASQGLYHLNIVLGVQHTDENKQFRVQAVFHAATPQERAMLHLYLYYDVDAYCTTYTERAYISVPMRDYLQVSSYNLGVVLHWMDIKTNTVQIFSLNWR